jgi:hypothetical protein
VTNPVGTPPSGGANLGAAVPTQAASIYNLPTGLKPDQQFWFDTGHTQENVNESHRGGISNEATQAANGHYRGSFEQMSNPEKVMAQMYQMSITDPGSFIAIQTALAQMPEFGAVRVTGNMDPVTEAALGKAMAAYVKLTVSAPGTAVPISFRDYLTQSAEKASMLQQQQQAATGANTVRVTDPDTIRAAAQSAAMQSLGQAQLDQFVSKFQQEQLANGADSFTTNLKLPGEAEAFAQQSDPKAYSQNQHQTYVDALVNMLGGSKTSRPNMGQVTPPVGG